MSSKKPQTVGGSTMGMVNTESRTPLRRLDVPMTRHAANSPNAKEMANARPLKPQTVGGSTMGMVNTESRTPLRRLDVPMTRHAANSPNAKEMANARPLVLSDTQNGR